MGIKFKSNQEFFQKWNPTMSYVLGFWYADGSVDFSPQIRGHYIRVGSTDKEVITYIKRALDSQHAIYTLLRPGRKTFYLLQIGSKGMFNDLQQLGVVERKANIITFPEVPKELLNDFIRGYFDGDGCVSIEKTNTGSYKRLITVFTSGSKIFLQQLQTILILEANVTHKKISITRNTTASTAYQLRYSTRESLKLFYFLYTLKQSEFFLTRKYKVFIDYLETRNINHENLEKVLLSKGPIIT
jgi:hypothetical protein